MKVLASPRELDAVRVSGGTGQNIDTYMTICEIMLYRQADCLPGKYGVNCSKECHCLSGPCESVTGTCMPALCKDGWRGPTCNKTCDPGYFGKNCSSACHCYNGSSCHRVSGHCPDGQCEPGWTQSNCSVACKPGFYGQSCSMDCHCDMCHHVNGSCGMSPQCHDGYRMENGFCKQLPECHCDRYYNALLAVSSALAVVVAAVIVVIVVYSIRKHRQSAGGTRSKRESSAQEMYDDLKRKSTNLNYDCLQMSNGQRKNAEKSGSEDATPTLYETATDVKSMRPPRMSKAPDKEPSYCIVPFMLWNNWITLRSLGGQPIFARTMNSQSLLKKSFALVRSKKARKRGLCYSLYYYYSCLIEKFISMVDLSEQSAHIDSGNILESLYLYACMFLWLRERLYSKSVLRRYSRARECGGRSWIDLSSAQVWPRWYGGSGVAHAEDHLTARKLTRSDRLRDSGYG
ncbi:multiple epidermal growth factor-like domains protein 10 [Dreissena polymorpha]|uniref:multiple epidermal growth factor-like domains protein 10 n=1 Tax=Dreissena polymorpha TaxID=45954 RepID=UPI002263CBB3|nr:multiple epidermal growth factor-like domains protein 10 [Dreissena polymorpha]